jgi:hypothetical protein
MIPCSNAVPTTFQRPSDAFQRGVRTLSPYPSGRWNASERPPVGSGRTPSQGHGLVVPKARRPRGVSFPFRSEWRSRLLTERFMEFHPDVIEVTDRVRDLDDAKVAELAGSIAAIGQIAPIVVFSTELADRIILVAGWR